MVWDNLLAYIHKEKPDILALQEVYDGTSPDLEKRFRTMKEFEKEFGEFLPNNAFGATIFDTGVNIKWGNAIFSKFPIKTSKTIFFDLPYSNYNFTEDPDPRLAAEGMLEGELDVNGKKVFVYSWHGVWDHHGGDTEKRQVMQEKICNSLKGKERIILAGDTNVNPDTNVVKNIIDELGVESIFGQSLKTTFNLKRKENKGNYDKSPVDMIFVSKNIKVLQSKMHEVDVSDHYPLEATLEI